MSKPITSTIKIPQDSTIPLIAGSLQPRLLNVGKGASYFNFGSKLSLRMAWNKTMPGFSTFYRL